MRRSPWRTDRVACCRPRRRWCSPVTDAGRGFGDPITALYWQAARQHRLLIQRCSACGSHQFYPRPFCLSCDRDDALEWTESSGIALVHSVVTVHMKVIPELEPPYQVAVVEL